MIKRVVAICLSLSLFFYNTVTVFACDEQQTKVYVSKILFGENALQYEKNKDSEKLLSAIYICSEQSNRDGQDKLNLLKNSKVRNVPTLEKINISNDCILDYSHNIWSCESKDKIQEMRKDILKKTVVNVFDFGWINEHFRSNSGQIDSFTALLYYIHILADYLADDPIDTEISVKGYDIPAYSGKKSVQLNGNIPMFTEQQKKDMESYKEYSNLDEYGRCGAAITVIGPDTLESVEARGDISKISPTGWIDGNIRYEGLMADYLYNRCHLVAHSLGGADTLYNLVTGTRYLNESMEIYELEVVDYIKSTGNHVLYRVTPVYVGDNRIASGVQLEAYSVEDKGKGKMFNVYLYNIQPGVDIDYANGNSERADNVFGQSNVLPFATDNVSDKNPDLMYEISKQLEILFVNQKENKDYKNMMSELNEIASEARSVSGNSEWKVYMELKKYQYDYVEKLSEYVPKLLLNEEFFKSAFN